MAEKRLITREEAAWEDTWAIEDLYRDDREWEEDFRKLEQDIRKLSQYQGRLGECAELLLEAQRTCEELNRLAEKVYVYAGQRLHENTDNSTYQNLSNRAQGLLVFRVIH